MIKALPDILALLEVLMVGAVEGWCHVDPTEHDEHSGKSTELSISLTWKLYFDLG